MDPYIGEVRIFAGNFPPRNWAFCDGQLLPIAENTALFSLVGTTYGGNGTSTFALPDLRGRAPMHQGRGAGLTMRFLGEPTGQDQVTLTLPQIPSHNHQARAVASAGQAGQGPEGAYWAAGVAGRGPTPLYAAGGNLEMAPGGLAPEGGNEAHDNQQPFQVLNFIICLQGIYPPRS